MRFASVALPISALWWPNGLLGRREDDYDVGVFTGRTGSSEVTSGLLATRKNSFGQSRPRLRSRAGTTAVEIVQELGRVAVGLLTSTAPWASASLEVSEPMRCNR